MHCTCKQYCLRRPHQQCPSLYQDDSPYPSLCQEGYDRVIIKTVDTDAAVLAVAALHSIPVLKELWVDFGINEDHRYISVHGIAKALGKQKAEALPLFMHPQDVIPFHLLME